MVTQLNTFLIKLRKIICKTKRSDLGLGGGKHYNGIQTGGDANGDGDNMVGTIWVGNKTVGLGTKYFTVSSSTSHQFAVHVFVAAVE